MTFGLLLLASHLGQSASSPENLQIFRSSTSLCFWPFGNYLDVFSSLIMARNILAKDQFVKLIVGAGQASPSPPVGPALGSKGVKSMDFCKEFNARTAHINTGVPIPARVTVRPDRSFSFELRTPTTTYLLLNAANVEPRKNRLRGAMNPGHELCGKISLKHVYEIAKLKHTETRLSGLSLEGLCKSVISQAKSIGIQVVP
ncbi:unnamed protein product [Penicillium nalgiovense]|uniref:Large ribosomal subunit protein uL11m n=1 Tax=Penicillium nalgiovense TaxID=60175 RepID=A0A9W4IJG0_PENNA|nr:unnamed protein product [Penicillium nalgiovense]CAG8109961.1 unnamed protein product [Penicillium nalgiovense]CAG8134217.1 unnamed protein product [Penicillium nalgiovense]CAG8148735.1 unnamed protein product [Penicillium nalgiovense]CAG8150233.1 unnamed protein product [Penicillium nalgiovense]